MLTCLAILTITLFFLTLYSILQTNSEVLHLENSRLISIKILDPASAATLFITLLGALLIRHQFALGVLPRINYKSTKAEKLDKQNPNKTFETWRIEIRNTGLGSAIINRSEYMLEHVRSKNGSVCYTFEDLLKELAKINLVRERDYWIENISNGFSLSPKDDCAVFEIKMDHINKLKRLHLVLYFQGLLGDRYSREIILIPQC